MNKRRITELLQVLPSLAQISPEQLSNIKFDEITSILLESIGFEREEILQDPEGVEKIKALQTQLEQISQAFEQAKQFTKATEVTALALTKLDGTAKGGVVIGISDQFKIPVKYIGIGEKLEHLQIFRRREFVESLFS